ncbi:MAG TPA: hypothetical protein VFQ73_07770 [Flavisolibacter sp.]|nr:hypothetical protein [Flavisolibacter sp.]
MKRILILFSATAILMVSVSSCAAIKKDCNGVKHTRLKNGIYL